MADPSRFHNWNIQYGGGAAAGGLTATPISWNTVKEELNRVPQPDIIPKAMSLTQLPQPWQLISLFMRLDDARSRVHKFQADTRPTTIHNNTTNNNKRPRMIRAPRPIVPPSKLSFYNLSDNDDACPD